MVTFSVNSDFFSDEFALTVWGEIQSNLGYFKKFNGANWEEAVQRTYIHVLAKRDNSFKEILPYIKKLARTILRTKDREFSNDVVTEKGDIAPIFSSLQDHIDTTNLDGDKGLVSALKELYLTDEKEFLTLKNIFSHNDVEDIENIKAIRIKNPKLKSAIYTLMREHGADYFFRTLNRFFYELPKLTSIRVTSKTKELALKSPNFDLLDKIPDTPTIKDKDGKNYFIDKTTLTMKRNPDYFDWDIMGISMCDILKIDLEPFMSYIYEEVFVDEGISTRHISWCGDKFRVTTPGGVSHVGIDRDKFINSARIELILNLISSNVGSILALSPDNLYVKPTRAFKYDKVRLRFQTGKIMDLPISVYKRR